MGQVLHGSATMTEAVRRTLQHSQESLRSLAKRHGVNQKTVARWKKRSSVADLPTGTKEARSTVLSLEDEAVVVAHASIGTIVDARTRSEPLLIMLRRLALREHVNDHQLDTMSKRAWNSAIHPVRARIEKVFGTAKRSYGLARARYLGRRRVSLQVHLTFIAYNLRRAVSLARPAPA